MRMENSQRQAFIWRSWLVIAGKFDAMFNQFVFPVYWPYCLQMHNLPCINCFEPAFSNLFNGYGKKKKFEHSRWEEGCQCGYAMCLSSDLVKTWDQCESVPPVRRPICTGQASVTVYQGHQQPLSHCRRRGWCIWPLTFTLYLAVYACVCLCLPMSWLWRALWPHLLSDAPPGLKTENQ